MDVSEHLPLIFWVAQGFARRTGHEVDELASMGALGLLRAAPRFDRARGTPATFARRVIANGIAEGLRELDPLSRDQRKKGAQVWHISLDACDEYGQSLYDVLPAGGASPEEAAAASEERRLFRAALPTLAPNLRKVLEDVARGRTAGQIAAALRVSPNAVRKLTGRAIVAVRFACLGR